MDYSNRRSGKLQYGSVNVSRRPKKMEVWERTVAQVFAGPVRVVTWGAAWTLRRGLMGWACMCQTPGFLSGCVTAQN